MIQRKPANRLGLNGPAEVKAHPWLKNFNWTGLKKREIDPPFKPSVLFIPIEHFSLNKFLEERR